MSKSITYRIFLIGLLAISQISGKSQTEKVTINPYIQNITIGEQIRVDLHVNASTDEHIIWPAFSDTITDKIDIVEVKKIDTLYSDSIQKTGILGYSQQIIVSSFDSGLWAFPEVIFWIDSLQYTTDAFLIEVNTVEVDTSKAFKDIVQPIEIPFTFFEYIKMYYTYGLLLYAILVVLAIIAYFLGKDANKGLSFKPEITIPPHVIALNRLEQLESEKLWQSGAYKAFHIQVSDITREYIENRFHIPVLESTTDEINHLLRQTRMDKKLRTEIIASLRISDLAKFAKAIPLPEENEECIATAYKLVEVTKIDESQSNVTNE